MRHYAKWNKSYKYCIKSYVGACSVAKLHLTLCNPIDCSLSGSSVHGILQTRVLEWIAMPSSRGSSQPRDQTCISCTTRGCFFFYHWATWKAQSLLHFGLKKQKQIQIQTKFTDTENRLMVARGGGVGNKRNGENFF